MIERRNRDHVINMDKIFKNEYEAFIKIFLNPIFDKTSPNECHTGYAGYLVSTIEMDDGTVIPHNIRLYIRFEDMHKARAINYIAEDGIHYKRHLMLEDESLNYFQPPTGEKENDAYFIAKKMMPENLKKRFERTYFSGTVYRYKIKTVFYEAEKRADMEFKKYYDKFKQYIKPAYSPLATTNMAFPA